MARYLSEEDVMNQYVQAMGPDLGSLCCRLKDHIAWLNYQWKFHGSLFRHSSGRTGLLECSAGAAFETIEWALRDVVLSSIARLMDPPSTCGQANLSLKALPELIGDSGLKDSVNALLEEAESTCMPIRAWRNKQLSHLDFRVEMGQAHPPGFSAANVSAAVNALGAVLGPVHRHFKVPEPAYQYTWGGLGGVDDLIKALERARSVAGP